jgi:putative DNA methylase
MKKLIEVALPLEAINKASAKEKSIRHGHPSTLHLWWARRRLFNSPPQSPKAFMQF